MAEGRLSGEDDDEGERDRPDEAPETPPTEPEPVPVEEPPPKRSPDPYVVDSAIAGREPVSDRRGRFK